MEFLAVGEAKHAWLYSENPRVQGGNICQLFSTGGRWEVVDFSTPIARLLMSFKT